MINITICDDDKHFLKLLKQKITSYLANNNQLSYTIKCFNSIETLLEYNISEVNILFLDVRFKAMSGIDAAKILRELSSHFILIFVSSYIEYAPAGYSVNAFRYILKEQIDIFLDEALNNALFQLGYKREKITFKFIGHEFNSLVYTDTILYLESQLHEVHFHFIDGHDTYLYDTLNNIQSKLPSNEFIRIHQSYLVNLKHFLDAKNYQAQLYNNQKLPISQKLFSKVKKQLYLYKGKI